MVEYEGELLMKEHIYSEMINDLRDVAIKFHNTQQLRERISAVVNTKLIESAKWLNGKEI